MALPNDESVLSSAFFKEIRRLSIAVIFDEFVEPVVALSNTFLLSNSRVIVNWLIEEPMDFICSIFVLICFSKAITVESVLLIDAFMLSSCS